MVGRLLRQASFGRREKLLRKNSFRRSANWFKIFPAYILSPDPRLSISIPEAYFQLVLLSVEKTWKRAKIDQQ